MEKILKQYDYNPKSEEINATLAEIESNLESWRRNEVLYSCIGFTDLTTLKTEDTPSKVASLTEKVNNFKREFPDAPYPASICVYPNFASVIRDNLKVKGVDITTVAGCFPCSQSFLEVKELECRLAAENGANEIDIVLAHNSFLEGNYKAAAEEISSIRRVLPKEVVLKVILESGSLAEPEKIAAASYLAMEAGADFIKTSTGKQEPAATPQAAVVMCNCIKSYYHKSGRKVGFKPAGGISTTKDALTYYAIVESILGKEWLNKDLFRIGASRLVNNLLTDIKGTTVKYF